MRRTETRLCKLPPALFQVIAQLYLKGRVIITSHAGIATWADRFADPMMAAAVLDRLLHRAYHNGLLLLSCGVSTLRFMPPLSVNEAEVDEALTYLRQSLDEALAGEATVLILDEPSAILTDAGLAPAGPLAPGRPRPPLSTGLRSHARSGGRASSRSTRAISASSRSTPTSTPRAPSSSS